VAIDTTKSKFRIDTLTKESSNSSAVVSLTTPKEALSEEEQDTLNNVNASNKFKIINKEALNPMKPVVIANTEFIPIAKGNTSPDSTGLKAQFGEGNLLDINSVAKLFEIQRQIRKVNLANAESLLKDAKGYNNSEILSAIREKVESVFDDIIDKDINVAIDNFVNVVSRKQNSGRKTKKKNPDANKTIAVRIPKKSTLESVNSERSEDPYYRTLVEYAIYEVLVQEAIEYLSGILRIKESALKSWSVLESVSYTTIQNINETDSGFPSNVQQFITDSGLLGGSAKEIFKDPASDKFAKVLDLPSIYLGTDTALIIESFVNAYETIHLNYPLSQRRFDEDNRNRTIGLNADIDDNGTLYDALEELQQTWLISTYIDAMGDDSNKKNPYFTDDTFRIDKEDVRAVLSEPGVDGFFGDNKIGRIMNKFPNSLDDMTIYSELLAACLFNDAMAIQEHRNSQTANAFRYLDGTNVPRGSIKDYYDKLLGPRASMNIRGAMGGDVNFDPLVSAAAPPPIFKLLEAKTDTGLSTKYIPFESTRKYPSDESYLTGPEFLIDVALQRGDEEFTEFTNLVSNYKNFANAYIDDVDNRLGIYEVEDSFLALCRMISDDLFDQAKGDMSNTLLRLALLVKQSKTRKGIVRAFKSGYLGDKLKSRNKDTARGNGSKRGDPFLQNDRSITRPEALRRAVRYKTDVFLKDFIDNTLNVDRVKTKRDKDFRTLGGDKFDALKQKEYTEKDKRFHRLGNSAKVINRGSAGSMSKKRTYTIKKQSGRKYSYDGPGDINKEQALLDRGLRYGKDSLSGFLNNEHFLDTLFDSKRSELNSFNNKRPGLIKGETVELEGFNKKFPRSLKNQGAILKLSEHHRAFILYAFVAKILQRHLTVKAKSFNPKRPNNARIEIIFDKDKLLGVANAFKFVGISGTDAFPENINQRSEAFRNAFFGARETLQVAQVLIKERAKRIGSLISIPAMHAANLKKQRDKIVDYVQRGDGSDRSLAAIDLLKDRKIRAFEDTVSLISEESVSEMYHSYINTFVPIKNSMFTVEDKIGPKQVKLMFKILSNPGYGFLSSEKRGNLVVSHVGITNSMLSTMRFEAFRITGNLEFLESKRFCVNIFKRNEIDAEEVVYPKTFLFDSKLQLNDYNQKGELLNHLSNYSDSWTFDNVVNNMEFTRWTDKRAETEDEPGDPYDQLKEAYRPRRQLGSDLLTKRNITKELLINHINDYALKHYYRFGLGLDFDTYSFVLRGRGIDFRKPDGGFSTARLEMAQNYDDLINRIVAKYPAANIDEVLASELFRGIKTIGATPIYSLGTKTKRVFLPKKFDRVLSIPYNDKDFVLYTPIYDEEFRDIFKTTPNFSYTSKIIRPDFKPSTSNDTTKNFRSELLETSTVEKYKKNCRQDFPEVFSTYVTITILPDETK
jgi:hypothetical protein